MLKEIKQHREKLEVESEAVTEKRGYLYTSDSPNSGRGDRKRSTSKRSSA